MSPPGQLTCQHGSASKPMRTAAATSALRQVVNTGRRLTLLNRHAISARSGLILSGAAVTGKTTAITQFGKTHEAIDRLRHPGIGDRIPVIYVTVPPSATQRMLAVEFARRRPGLFTRWTGDGGG
jgi:hypothetical protein